MVSHLNYQAHLKSLDDDLLLRGMEDVCDTIDWEQSSYEEKAAMLALVTHHKASKDTGEWEPLSNDNLFGDFDADKDTTYYRLIDENEMSLDMDYWEDEFACHELFAANPWDQRPVRNNMIDERQTPLLPVNKRSEVEHWTEVTKVGPTYTTCESDFGKVFVPKHMMGDHKEGDMLYLKSQFKGFESARQTALPWRALRILRTSPEIM